TIRLTLIRWETLQSRLVSLPTNSASCFNDQRYSVFGACSRKLSELDIGRWALSVCFTNHFSPSIVRPITITSMSPSFRLLPITSHFSPPAALRPGTWLHSRPADVAQQHGRCLPASRFQ